MLPSLALLLAPPALADPMDDARRHFQAGLAAVGEGRLQDAIHSFELAQAAMPHPATLYNIGKAWYDLGDLPIARRYLLEFRAQDPARAGLVDPLLTDIDARLAASAAPPAPSAPHAAGTAEDAARLQAIVSDLRRLTDELAARGSALGDGAPPDEGGTEPPPEPAPAPAPAPAPQPGPAVEAPALDLDEVYRRVVVTASRTGQDPLDSPSTVTVLTAEDIRLSGALDVPDLLRRVAGVEVMAPTSGHSDLAIRGFQRKLNNTVLVLVDGRSQYLDFFGPTFWGPIPLQLEEIERIEVIRGPGSAVYGANAVTGVVNLITRTPGEGPSSLSATAGTVGVGRYSAVASGRSGAAAFRFSAGYQEQGAWSKPYAAPEGGPVEVFPSDDDLALGALRMNARVDRPLGSWGAASLTAGLSDSTTQFVSFGVGQLQTWEFHNQVVRGDLFVHRLHLRSFWTNSTGTLDNSYTYVGRRPVRADHDNDVVDVEIELPGAGATGPVRHQYDVGAGYRYKGMRWDALQGGFERLYVENHFSAFGTEQATWGPASLAGSMRVDVHPLIDVRHTLSPRGAFLLRVLDHTTLRATAGSAFRAPAAVESYLGFDTPTSLDAAYIAGAPNRKLLPERIVTLELGAHDESTPYHRVDVVGYYNRVTNLIATADIASTVLPYDPRSDGYPIGVNTFQNLDPVHHGYGSEAELELYPADGVDLFANGSVNRVVQVTDADRVVDGSSSLLKANVGASWTSPAQVDLSAWVNWVSAQEWPIRVVDPQSLSIVVEPEPLPARTLVSARVAARPIPGEDLELAVTGWNLVPLFGAPYREHPQGQLTATRVYGTVTWRFPTRAPPGLAATDPAGEEG